MNFDYSETQQMLLETAERVMKARGSVEKWRARRALADGLDVDGWREFAELGWLALPVPEDADGLGGTMEDVVLLMTALGGGLSVEPYVSTAVIASYIIDCAGGEQRLARLAEIAAGETRYALAHGEPDERYDTAAERATTAHRNGQGFRLQGVKLLALDAPSAHRLLVSARIEGEPGTALFVVDAGTAGVTMDVYPLIDGSKAADIHLQDVQLPTGALLCADAAALLSAAIDRATLALLGQAVGAMEACLDICGAYLKERRQFGQPIGSFQALQHMITDMLVATHQSRSMVYRALSKCEGPAAERSIAVSRAKMVAGEAMQLVSRTGIQLHGGYGLTDEYAISHYFNRLLVLEKSYGDVDYHARRLAA